MNVLHTNCPEIFPHAFSGEKGLIVYMWIGRSNSSLTFLGGSFCCKTNLACDNTEITRCSKCCLYDDYIKCPAGVDCQNYGSPSNIGKYDNL